MIGPIGGPDAFASVTLVVDGKTEWAASDGYKQTFTSFQDLANGTLHVVMDPAGEGFTWSAGNERHEVWFIGPSVVLSLDADPTRPRRSVQELARGAAGGETPGDNATQKALFDWALDHFDDEIALAFADACIRGKLEPDKIPPEVVHNAQAAKRLAEHFNALLRTPHPDQSLEVWDKLTRGLEGRSYTTLPKVVFVSWPDGRSVEGVVEAVNPDNAGVWMRAPIEKNGFAAIETGDLRGFRLLVRATGADPQVCFGSQIKLVAASRSLEVFVTDGRTPVANAEVTLVHDRTLDLGEVLPPIPMKKTGTDGVARFDALAPSRFFVRIRGPGDERHEETLREVPSGTAGTAQRIKLDLGALESIVVTVLRPDGTQPVVGREFMVSPNGQDSEFMSHRVVTDRYGRFVFRGLSNPNAKLFVKTPNGTMVGTVSRDAPTLFARSVW